MSRECKLVLSFLVGFLAPFILYFAVTAYPAPFLVCDPQPASVTHYVVSLDDNVTIVEAQKLESGEVRLHFDLAGISEGQHHVEVKAKNMWGESEAVPFDFTKSLPVLPTGFSISAD